MESTFSTYLIAPLVFLSTTYGMTRTAQQLFLIFLQMKREKAQAKIATDKVAAIIAIITTRKSRFR